MGIFKWLRVYFHRPNNVRGLYLVLGKILINKMLKKFKQIVSQGDSSKTFSYSQLNTFKTCPQQYKIIYMDVLRKEHESIEAFMGKRVHGVMEWLYSKENRENPYITFDRLCQSYDEQW